MFCYPILTLVKREPSNHLPTNIFDILLGIWYLWLLYRVHLGLLHDRTTFTPYGVSGNILYLATFRYTNGEIIRDFYRYWSHEDEKQQFSILSSLSLKM